MKICIIGAGSTYTPELVSGLIKISTAVDIDEISLLDIKESEKKFDILSAFAHRMVDASRAPIKCTAILDPIQAITGADFVVFQFRSGLLEGRIHDEKIPLDYQLIGQETTGVGGMANGIRSFPIVEEYLDIVRRESNHGWIVNFTNPSGMLTEFIINYLHYDRCIGLCNAPIKFIMKTAEALKCDREDVLLRHYGLNHLSVVDRFVVSGDDRTEEALNNISVDMKNISKIEYQPGFIADLGMLPNPYLKYFFNTRKMLELELEERDGKGTRGEVVQGIEEELLSLYSDEDRTEAPEELSGRGGFMYSTVATELIRSLALGDGKNHIVNTPNNGAISSFPNDYVMEITTTVDTTGATPLKMGEANKAIIGLIHTIKNHERLTIEGYLNGDEDLFKHAMLIHPLGPDESQLNALWNDLKRANAAYFQEFS